MGGSSKGQSSGSNAPQPWVQAGYQNLFNQAQAVGSKPFSPYTGQLVTPVNEQQLQGIGNINQYAGWAMPYFQNAGNMLEGAAQPLTAQQIQQYYSPYQQNVIDATERQFQNSNAQQQQQLLSSAASQGALGGNRVGIGQAILAGQQQMAQAPVIAGLENQGYNQALQTAQQQFQQNPQAVAYGLGNIGTGGENAGLTGANAQIGAGTLEQQTQQNYLNALYQQYLMKQAYPFQTLGWEAGVLGGIGSQAGGTWTQQQPQPNPFTQLAGLGVAGVGAAGSLGWKPFAKDGGAVKGYDLGGTVPFDGAPYGGVSWMPKVQIQHGMGPPKPPQQGQQEDPLKMVKDAAGIFKHDNSAAGPISLGTPVYNDSGVRTGILGVGPTDAGLPTAPAATDPLGPGRYAYGGLIFPKHNRIELRKGGPVRAGLGMASFVPGFADGGTPFEERFVDPTAVPLSPEGFNYRFGTPGAPDNMYSQPVIDAAVAHGLGSPYAPLPMPRSRPDNAPTMVAEDDLPPEMRGLGTPAPNALAYADDGAPPTHDAGLGYQPIAAPDTSAIAAAHRSDPWMALMSAGLGMMASRSPFAGVAIGEGGLQGLAQYQALRKEELAEKTQAQNMQLHVDQLNQLAKYHQGQLGVAEKHIAQTEKHQTEQERLQQENIERQLNAPRVMTPGQQLVDPHSGKVIATNDSGSMSDAAVDLAVDRIHAGDPRALQNIGRGAQSGINLTRIQNRLAERATTEGWTGADIAAAQANFGSQAAAARTAAVRSANVETAIEEAQQTFPLAITASENLPRTSFVPWNKLEQMVREGTSNPAQIKYNTAIRGAITAYSQAMSRTGVNSVHAQQAAEELINRATGHEGIVAAFEQMEKEMQAAKVAPDIVRKHILERISGRTSEPPPPTKSTKVPTLEQFLSTARAKNPGVSDKDLTDYYNKTYGTKP